MSQVIQPPDGAARGSGRVLVANRDVLAQWEALVDELTAEEVTPCYDDLANNPYPQDADLNHAPVKDLQDFIDPPAWERRLRAGSHIVFYRRGEDGAVIVYAGKRGD